MLHQPLMTYHIGYFRDCEVRIGGRYGEPYQLVPGLIDVWCKTVNDGGRKIFGKFIKMDWKDLHVWYEEIHPFADGNGRTGRMFMNWHRLKVGLPLLIIHKGEEQFSYYEWFKETN